jgi:RNA polymerase sigma-32 factor
MNRRLSGDASLNAPFAPKARAGEWQDWLVDDHDSQEDVLIEQDELETRRRMLKRAMSVLNDRERRIFEARRLSEDPDDAGRAFRGVRHQPRARAPDRGSCL